MKLVGKAGESFFDGWTIVHIAFWIVVAANFDNLQIPMITWGLGLIFAATFVWEIIETGLEKWTDLVGVHESWLNRWVSDPLMGIVGGLIGYYVV